MKYSFSQPVREIKAIAISCLTIHHRSVPISFSKAHAQIQFSPRKGRRSRSPTYRLILKPTRISTKVWTWLKSSTSFICGDANISLIWYYLLTKCLLLFSGYTWGALSIASINSIYLNLNQNGTHFFMRLISFRIFDVTFWLSVALVFLG